METMLQVSVDSNILMRAQKIAMEIDKTVPELINEYLLSITKKKQSNVINSYEELLAALEEGQRAFEEGRVVSEEVGMARIKQLAGIK